MAKFIHDQGILKRAPVARQVGRQSSKPKAGIALPSIKRLMSTQEPRICIERSLGGIGDVIMSTPAIRALRSEFPKAYIVYATDFKYADGSLNKILQCNSYIDKVVPYQTLNKHDFDFVCDITTCCIEEERKASREKILVSNRIDIFANHIGVSLANTGTLPDYIVSSKEQDWAAEKLARYPLRSKSAVRIGVQVRASTMARTWPIERTKELIGRLVKDGVQVWIFDSSHGGGPVENWDLAGTVNCKDYGIREIAALLNEMDLLVAPDSGLMHIAGALNKRMVTLWAGTDPNARINYYPNAVAIVNSNYKCVPCWYSPTACNSTYACIKSITVDEVFLRIKEHLQVPICVVNSTQGIPALSKAEQDCLYLADTVISKNSSVLINRCSGFGDVLMTTALARTLREKFPYLEITMRTNHPWIFDGNKDVTRTIQGNFESNPTLADLQQFGYIINLNYALESPMAIGKHALATEYEYMNMSRIDLLYAKAGIQQNGIPKLVYNISDVEKENAYKTIKSLKYPKTIIYVLNSTSVARTYPLDLSFDVIRQLCNKYNVLTVGNIVATWTKEHPIVSEYFENIRQLPRDAFLGIAENLSLRQKAAFFGIADLVITPDTGFLHLVGALDVPCIALFGNVMPELRCKYYPKVYPLSSCLPCTKDCGDRFPYMNTSCPDRSRMRNTHTSLIGTACMRSINPKVIIEQVEELLSI